MRGYIPPADDEERLFVRRIADLVRSVEARGVSRSTGFLSDRQQDLARAALSKAGFPAENAEWNGGYEEAERRILTLRGEYGQDEWPAQCVRLEVLHPEKTLTHRDYLGALMSLGVKRECIGDIIPDESGAYLFVLDGVASLVYEELTGVGRCSVRVTAAQGLALPLQQKKQARTATVPSLRLDAVLAAMLHVSRGSAAQLVKSGMVEVNHVATSSVHYEVYENDVFSVRGRGKFKLCEAGAQSRKGRTFVSYIEY